MKQTLTFIFCSILFLGCWESTYSLTDYIIPTELKDIPSDPMNELTQEKVDAGEYFFFNKAISEDGRISCANCHNPKNSFLTPDPKFIGGCGQGCILTEEGLHIDEHYDGKVDNMNKVKSLGASGIAYSKVAGWSGRFGMLHDNIDAQHDILEHFKLHAFEQCEPALFQAFVALGGHRQLMRKRLMEDTVAIKHLNTAFHIDSLESKTDRDIQFMVACALDAFQRVEGLNSAINSKFQEVAEGRNTFTIGEKIGWDMFNTSCISCHSSKVFSGGIELAHQGEVEFNPDHRREITGVGIPDDGKIYRSVRPLRNNISKHDCWGVDCSFDSLESYVGSFVSDQDSLRYIVKFLKTL